MADFLSAHHSRASAAPNSNEEAFNDSERLVNLESLVNDWRYQPSESSPSDIWKSLGAISDPAFLDGEQQDQANSELWETLLENNSATFSRRSLAPMTTGTSYNTHAECLSSQQLTCVSPNVSAAQSAINNEFDFSTSVETSTSQCL